MTSDSDRELLLKAAKAAGLKVWPGASFQAGMLFTAPHKADPDGKVTGVEWNPLTDDGDALRLAVKLGIDVLQGETQAIVRYVGGESIVEHDRDQFAATRRAIVRAAAAIGTKT